MGFAGSSGSRCLVLARAVGSSEDLSEEGITPKFTLVLGRSIPHKLFDRGNQFHAAYWPRAFCSSLFHGPFHGAACNIAASFQLNKQVKEQEWASKMEPESLRDCLP